MDDSLKKRLVGAVVLVSLAVIFLPMLMEDGPVVTPGIEQTNIPPRPVIVRKDEKAPESTQEAEEPEVSRVSTELAEPVPLPPPETATNGDTTAQPAMPPAESAEKVANATTPETESKANPPKSPSGWVVQVATFADKTNADSTLAKLRLAGFDSFAEEVAVKNKVLYRVRVGPVAKRDSAEVYRTRIAEELKLKGQVQRYP